MLIKQFKARELSTKLPDIHGDVFEVVVVVPGGTADNSLTGVQIDADPSRVAPSAHPDENVVLLDQEDGRTEASHGSLAVADGGEEELSLERAHAAPHHPGARLEVPVEGISFPLPVSSEIAQRAVLDRRGMNRTPLWVLPKIVIFELVDHKVPIGAHGEERGLGILWVIGTLLRKEFDILLKGELPVGILIGLGRLAQGPLEGWVVFRVDHDYFSPGEDRKRRRREAGE